MRRLSLLTVCSLMMATAACGGSSASDGDTESGSGTSGSSQIELPDQFADKDTFVLAVGALAPPQSFIPAGKDTPEGFDVDLGSAVAKALGKKVKLVPMPFDAILPALGSGRADIGLSGFTDTKERQKVVDFVNYLNVGSSFFAKTGSPIRISSLDDLCGHSIGVSRATAQAEDMTQQSKKCGADKPLRVSTYPDQNAANLAITSGRVELSVTDTPVAAYMADKSAGKLAILGEPYGAALAGMAVPKNSGLAESVQEALDQIIADGTYAKILQKWKVEQIAVEKSTINAGTR